jgi:hypothetical protein
MRKELDPIVGNWYQHLDKGQTFRVVALDDINDMVEIQHLDGDLEEVDLETWYEFDLEPCAEPEDWTAPMDDIEVDDLDVTETTISRQDRADALAELKPPAERFEQFGEEIPPPEFDDDAG